MRIHHVVSFPLGCAMRIEDLPVGPSPREWADASLKLTKLETSEPEQTIYELRKTLVINGVAHVQYVWLNQQQLRGVGIDYGL